jgi:hypothetical protein
MSASINIQQKNDHAPLILIESQDDYVAINKFIDELKNDKIEIKILCYFGNWLLCSCQNEAVEKISEWLHDNEKMNHLSSIIQTGSGGTMRSGYETCINVPNISTISPTTTPKF